VYAELLLWSKVLQETKYFWQ